MPIQFNSYTHDQKVHIPTVSTRTDTDTYDEMGEFVVRRVRSE